MSKADEYTVKAREFKARAQRTPHQLAAETYEKLARYYHRLALHAFQKADKDIEALAERMVGRSR